MENYHLCSLNFLLISSEADLGSQVRSNIIAGTSTPHFEARKDNAPPALILLLLGTILATACSPGSGATVATSTVDMTMLNDTTTGILQLKDTETNHELNAYMERSRRQDVGPQR